jgi:hypothetical protein
MAKRFFTKLSPGMNRAFEESLETCRRGWEATGDPLTVAKAIQWTDGFHQPIAPWLGKAAVQALLQLRSKGRAQQHQIDMKHFFRWAVMRAVKGSYVKDSDGQRQWKPHPRGKPSWARARELAAEELATCGDHVTRDTVKASYEIVEADMRAGRGGKYFGMQPPHRKIQKLG